MIERKNVNHDIDIALEIFGSGLITNIAARDNQHNNSPTRSREPETLEQVIEAINKLRGGQKPNSNDRTLRPSRYDKKNDKSMGLYGLTKFEDIDYYFLDWLPEVGRDKREYVILHYDELSAEKKTAITMLNSWLTFVANKLYLSYCTKNNVVPEGRISIPEHFTNEIYLAENQRDAMNKIALFIGNYVEDNKGNGYKVYHNCYAKYLTEALNKTGQNPKEQIPKLIPRYNQNFKFTPLNNSNKENQLQMAAAENILNTITAPRYLGFARGQVEALSDMRKADGCAARYDFTKRRISIPQRDVTETIDFVHEETHEIVRETDLWRICCDILYENTKGEKFSPAVNFYSKYYDKDLLCKGRIDGLPINTTVVFDATYEKYSKLLEFLPELMNCLLQDVKVELTKKGFFGSNKSYTKEELNQINNYILKEFEAKLKLLYDVNRDFALFVIAYINDQLQPK